MSKPPPSRNFSSSNAFVRVNGKIRAREVRVIGHDGSQLGIHPINEALTMARNSGVDLVEIAPNATPPVCRIVDYGKYRYEQAKKEKESKRHQHANKVKEIQLSPTIDAHDFGVKLSHAIDFLCEEMKIKITLRFRGREMAHQEIGFQTIQKFLKELTTFGTPDSPPKLLGRGINVMVSPLPRNKRAKNPNQNPLSEESMANYEEAHPDKAVAKSKNRLTPKEEEMATEESEFTNNPFSQL